MYLDQVVNDNNNDDDSVMWLSTCSSMFHTTTDPSQLAEAWGKETGREGREREGDREETGGRERGRERGRRQINCKFVLSRSYSGECHHRHRQRIYIFFFLLPLSQNNIIWNRHKSCVSVKIKNEGFLPGTHPWGQRSHSAQAHHGLEKSSAGCCQRPPPPSP